MGVPGQRACLACGAGRLVWETSPVLVTGARGGLGAACSREGVICAFSFTAGAVMGRPRGRRRYRSGWLGGFYQVANLTIRGVAPVDAVVPSACPLCENGFMVCAGLKCKHIYKKWRINLQIRLQKYQIKRGLKCLLSWKCCA